MGDHLGIAISTPGIWDYAIAYVPAARNFMMAFRISSAGGWFGKGQSGSPSTILDDFNGDQLSIHFDDFFSAATTRNGQYIFAQNASRALVNYDFVTPKRTGVFIGNYSGGRFTTPGNIYGFVLR